MPLELFSVVFPNVLFSRDKNIGNGHCPASLTVARHWSVIFSPGDFSWIFPCSLLDCTSPSVFVHVSCCQADICCSSLGSRCLCRWEEIQIEPRYISRGEKNCLSTSLMHRHTTEPRCILMRRYLMHLTRIKLNCLPFPVKELLLPLLIKSQLMMVVNVEIQKFCHWRR